MRRFHALVLSAAMCGGYALCYQAASAPVRPAAPARRPPAQAAVPHLRTQGTARQLIVDGRPFIMLAGELHNSSASSLEYMSGIWERLAALNLNTVLATVSWELTEPEEGKYDFRLVDGLIQEAQKRRMRLVFLWFGSWKNGVSTYVPMWVKTDLKRFPRAQNKNGVNMDVVSPLCEAARDADAKAYRALMRHIRQVDSLHTVVMMQVENEVGLLGESRDRSPLAESAWNAPVPAELMAYLEKHKATLLPEVARVWDRNGAKTSGTWPEVFGSDPEGDEVFMAWQYAKYMGKVVNEGKAEHPIPMYVNAWLVQNEGQAPGRYPSGGPVSKMIDIYRAAAPQIDLLAPDIYLPDFKAVTASYVRSGNPLFIPEASRAPMAAGNAFYAIGKHDALGFAPFGIDGIEGPHPLAESYRTLAEMMPLIAKYQGTGKMAGIVEQKEQKESFTLGDYVFNVEYRRRGEGEQQQRGFGIIIQTGPEEYLAAGSGFSVVFGVAAPGPKIARIGYIDEGRFQSGKWVAGRRMNGDENAGGYRLIFPGKGITIQKVRLYRHD